MPPEPNVDRYGRVLVSYSSFYLLGDANDFTGIHWDTNLVTARDGFLSIYSRSNDHYAAVRVVNTTEAPEGSDLSRWDSVVECGLFAAHPPELILPASPSGHGFDSTLHDLNIPAGPKGVRVSVRTDETLLQERLAADESPSRTDPSEAPEQFLIEIWDDPTGELATGKQIK